MYHRMTSNANVFNVGATMSPISVESSEDVVYRWRKRGPNRATRGNKKRTLRGRRFLDEPPPRNKEGVNIIQDMESIIDLESFVLPQPELAPQQE